MNKFSKVKNKIEKIFGHKFKYVNSEFGVIISNKYNQENKSKITCIYKCLNCNNKFFIGKNKCKKKFDFGFYDFVYGRELIASSYHCSNIIIKNILE